MTCVAAIAVKNKIIIGADSAGVSGLNLTIRADEKVFKKGPFVFGFTSSFRMGQLLRYKLCLPKQPARMNDYEFMVCRFIEAIRKCLKIGGFTKIDKNTESGGTFIVGYKGRIYIIEDDFQVSQPRDDLAAVGCGESYALGTLYSLRDKRLAKDDIQSACRKIQISLLAAEHFSAGVRAPFVIISSNGKLKSISGPAEIMNKI